MRITLQKKVLVTILGSLLLGIVIIMGLNISSVRNFSTESTDITFNAMKNEELENLARIANDRALFVNEFFKIIADDLNSQWSYATELLNGNINVTPIESYWADPDIDARIAPGEFLDEFYGPVSWEVSTIYLPGISNSLEYGAIDESTKSLIDETSNLDFIYKTLHASNPEYVWIYMGFEQAGLFRQLPYNDMTWARDENYDPREEYWYSSAVNQDDLNIILDLDPTSGLVVTTNRPVKYQNGSLVGVISVDMLIDQVTQVVSGDTILQNGYAYMLDQTLNTVVHPSLIQDPGLFGNSIYSIEFTSSQEKSDFQSILTSRNLNQAGQFNFTKDGKTWYLSYAPVQTGNFLVMVAVPLADIEAPARQMKEEILQSLYTKIITFIILTIIISLIIFLFANKASNKVVEPIKELTEVTKLVSQGNLTRDLKSDKIASSELNLLYDTFKGLITALRFGNEEYYAGNITRAMNNYLSALELFTRLNNTTGIGICHNNIGNIHKARGNLKDANNSYRTATTIGEELYNTSTGDEKTQHAIALASRFNNLGLLYKEIEQYDKSIEYMTEALKYDRSIDNSRGYATRMGNLGLIYLAKGDLKQAKETLDEAMDIAKTQNSDRALSYAIYNYGIYEKTIGNLDEAIDHFIRASELANDLDVRIITSSLANLKEIYHSQNKVEMVGEIDAQLLKIQGSKQAKEVTFVLDYSGSMAGKRIRSAVRGMENIFKQQIFDNDLVGIIIFNNQSVVLTHPQPKLGNERNFMVTFGKLTHPDGATAFYDALGMAIEDYLNRPSPKEQWI
ncbi:MAG: tetratricopeptide repeat protein, partial [Candidatus Heimdallarchaeota archaeon]|nr:tetratricopeptide repeat protein [Candidatus Heimdallarchaeota archaeon]